MKAELKDIYSTTLPNAYSSIPDDVANCWVDIHAEIGVKGEDAADTFVFQVCTIQRLTEIVEANGYLCERHLVVMESFDWNLVEQSISEIILPLEADDWNSLAKKIHDFGAWEYFELDDE